MIIKDAEGYARTKAVGEESCERLRVEGAIKTVKEPVNKNEREVNIATNHSWWHCGKRASFHY
jgi:hypothetical protein